MEKNQSLANRTRWLFTKEGLPVLISIVVGIVMGFFISGVLGLILATLAGFTVLYLFKRPPFRVRPWQALVTDLTPVVGKLFFAMAFLLPIADYLALPSGHTPNTLPKYLSIVFAVPKNLFSKPVGDIFPGFVLIIIISIVLMYWGSMNLEKPRHLLMAFGGLLLYTFSPTITGYLVGRPGIHILSAFFGVGYYFAWIGLLLLLVSKFLPNILKAGTEPAMNATGMLNLLPPVIAFGALAHFNTSGGTSHFQLFQLFDFESTHHFVAGVFSAGVAATSSGIIVGQAYREAVPYSEDSVVPTEMDDQRGVGQDSGEIGPPPEEPPDVPEELPPPQGPVPSTDPEDPPGTTIQNNPDGTSTKRRPDGFVGTKYSDGTVYVEGPNGEVGVYYPDGTTKEWTPESGLEVSHSNGDMEMTLPDGRTGGITNNQDGTIDITSPYGGKLHCPKDGNLEGSLTTYDGTELTFNGNGSGSMTSPYGGTMEIDKDGNMNGSWTDEKGNKFTAKPDGSFEVETAEGDKISGDADGIRAKFKDGSTLGLDADGNIKSAHIKDESGTLDLHTDDKGTMHVNDDKGNSANIKADGSGDVKGPDAEGSWDANGNAEFTADGTKWVTKSDGTGYVADKKGNRIDLNKDGSLTAKDARGKVTTYTADQVNQMKAQAGSGDQASAGLDSSAGGN